MRASDWIGQLLHSFTTNKHLPRCPPHILFSFFSHTPTSPYPNRCWPCIPAVTSRLMSARYRAFWHCTHALTASLPPSLASENDDRRTVSGPIDARRLSGLTAVDSLSWKDDCPCELTADDSRLFAAHAVNPLTSRWQFLQIKRPQCLQ